MDSAYSPSDATISDGEKDESRDSANDLELTEQNSEADSKIDKFRLLTMLLSSVYLV